MSFHSERPAGVMLGDIAAGDGYVGIVADLPGGSVGLALFGNPGQPRRIVHISSEACHLVKRAWEWDTADAHERETVAGLYRLQNQSLDRER